ncbi:putative ribonuclease H-like domain-containing protein [Tanacetum coccineum]|uniref:Ribonuclease H-like domain-containing protein n=1 Tax=Tanacetum coccineum TaxID=301880 RepID=A0ABQ5AEH8_9ASTR
MAEQDISPPTITAMEIPIIRKGEYDIWSMRMRQYICHTDHNLWDVIVNGDLDKEPAPTTGETFAYPAPKTAKQLAARRNQERVKSILLLAIPDEYLLKFHNVTDAKSLWEAIKSRFGDNVESKKIFQKLISQLEVHGAPISKEDINQKFLRSLPSSWNQIALIMRNKPDIDEIDIDDLYNNLRVYEDELKRSSGSNSASQNLAFLSSENTGSTNEVSTASGDFGVSAAGGINQVPTTPCAHDIAYSFLAQPTTSPQLENEDFQQMDGDDLEELDLRWQVAMLTVRVKKFIQRTGRNMDFKEKRHVSLDKSKIECYNCHRKGHFARECRSGRSQGRRSYGDNGRSNAPTNESSSQALVAQDGLGGYDWSNDFEVEPVNYALMAISSSSSSSSSDSEVQKCSKCLESFKCLQKNYDTEREKHNKAKLEIRGYEIALESLESRILGHEKNELAWGEKYEFQNYELKCREIKINNLNLELEKVVKERDELKDKIAKWEESTKNLDEILNSQMSARDKTGLGYSTQLNELSSNHETDSENSFSVFDGRSSDEDSTSANDRSSKAEGYKVVPPPITGNFLTPRADISFAGLDEYAIRNKIIESQTSELDTKTTETTWMANQYGIIPKGTARPSVSTARPSINTARPISNVRPSISTARPVYASRPMYPRMDNVRPRGSCSPIKRSYYTKPTFRPKDLKQDVKTFGVKNMTTAGTRAVVNTGKGKLNTNLKRTRWVWSLKEIIGVVCPKTVDLHLKEEIRIELFYHNKGFPMVDSGCSSHMTGNKAYLSDYEDFNGGFVAFGSDPKEGLENQLNHNVKIIRCDNRTEFKNYAMNEFCAKKGIKREFSVARTPQQNGVAERKNKTLIEAARTMLADSLLPIPFWVESTSSKAFRVYNKRTKRVEKNPHINFLEDQPNVAGTGPNWMFDLDFLTNSINYVPVSVENQVNVDAAKTTSTNQLSTDRPFVSTDRSITPNVSVASTPTGVNAGESSFVYLGGKIPIDASTLPNADLPIDSNMPDLEDASDTLPDDGIFNGAYDEDVGAVADFNNMDNTIAISPIPTLRIQKDHPKGQILGDPTSTVQTRGKIQKASLAQQALVSYIYKKNRTNHKDHQNCLFACFLSQEESKTISQALKDESWVEVMQEELLQFKLQKVWVLFDLPYGKKVIGIKWVFRNKSDERSIVVKNKARLVAQGFRHEEGIDYDEVFAPVARIEAIRLFSAFASYMGFTVYQMDIKSAFLYSTIEEEVYVHQPPGFVDPAHPNKDYKVIKALYGLHQAHRAWYETLSSFLMENGFRRDSDYGGASLDRKSTTSGCQFLGRRLISWQCKKQTIMANFTTKAEYVAAANCYLLTKGFDVTRISMDLRMDRCNAGKFYSYMVFNSGSLQVNSGGLLVNSVDLKLIMSNSSGKLPLVASIDSKEYTITEASVRSKLQLVDATGIPNLSDAEIYAGLATLRESMKMKEKSTDFVTPTKASGEAQEEDISPTILEAAKTLSKVASQGVSKVKSTDKGKRYRRRARSVAKNINTGLDAEEEINTGREEIHTGIEDVSTGSTKVDSGTASKRGQREGKAPMVEEDIQATHKTKEQIRQEEAGLEEAIKLQAQMDEEVAKQIHLDEMVAKRMAEEEALSEQQKKRKAQVQFEAQYYTEEDWDAIRAKLEANAELTKDVLGKDLPEQDRGGKFRIFDIC